MRHWNLLTHDVRPHNPDVLQSDRGEGRSILLALPAGDRLQEHVVQERAYLLVVDGAVEVSAGEDRVEAGGGALVVFEPREAHEVRAVSDARLLLVLAPWPSPEHRGEVRG